ncbi:PSP1 domain-containing protein [Schlesneria paludicola]|uniref:PSP1 domain-containing protein n=1 Tax=Schlesneria paludicola TaxID=360056 RepID=UPI00029B2E0D|nr:regulatory iron-sulfur-containing complex subunit RicT [Schlesneria paludicola]
MDTPLEDLSYVIRFGVTRILGEFTARGFGTLARGTEVIVRSDRGHEWGTILCTATDQTRTYLGANDVQGRVVRFPTPEDEVERDKSVSAEKAAFAGCLDLIRERNLQMQLVDVEQVIGGERMIFYYVSEQRVDFRDLVKCLAKMFHVRIEMRQIGIRDEAKLLADYGDCGQPVCCNTFLREMPPVSMKMAKLQKATLDPSKISGRCGRLKCCLRYEYDTYEEHRKELPPVGATVVTKQGTGRVVGLELLAQKLVISYEGQRQIMTDAKDVLTVVSTKSPKPAPPPRRDPPANEGGGREQPGKDQPGKDQPGKDRPRRDQKPREESREPRQGPRGRRDNGPGEQQPRPNSEGPAAGDDPTPQDN